MKYHVLVSFQNTTNCTTTILTFEPKQCSHTVLNHVWLSVTLMSNSARCHHRSLKWFPNKTSENFIYVVWFFNQCELDLYSIFHPFVYTVVSERVFSLLFSLFNVCFINILAGHEPLSWGLNMLPDSLCTLNIVSSKQINILYYSSFVPFFVTFNNARSEESLISYFLIKDWKQNSEFVNFIVKFFFFCCVLMQTRFNQ